MPKVSLEMVFFIVVLLVIAAAFDLWLIRAWKRYRRLHKRDAGGENFLPAFLKRMSAEKPPPQPSNAINLPPLPAVAASAR
jgi:hypothetical protein